ncbi:MAG: membrane integrity-associated transporter subunit PqiC [Oceanospirillaceae bacterium]|nr:membrane integrity-associated transporter subunit PqiC [Oceanospirillaceae bacterium]
MKLSLLFMAALLLLGGCSLAPPEKPISYYLLDSEPKKLGQKASSQRYLVNPIMLPDYLNQMNLVIRDADQRVHVAYYHSWVDSLANSVRRVLIRELNETNRDYGFTANCQGCKKINIQINHFYPTTAGEVILSGEYSIQGEIHRNFLITVNLNVDGYPHSVKKMQSALRILAKQISSNLLYRDIGQTK